LLIPGVVLLLGIERTKNFVVQPAKLKGLACFVVGVLMVI
jgi:hypothetical protein